MNRMNTRNNGAYFTWATRRYELPLMSKTTRLSARKSADPNIRRMSSGPFQLAPETMENQSRSGLSASACFLQKETSVLRLNTRTGAQIACSHFGINRSARQVQRFRPASREASEATETRTNEAMSGPGAGYTARWASVLTTWVLCRSVAVCSVRQRGRGGGIVR
jgi:hypothetical protein